MEEFIKKIIKNLEANGFPSKKVSLPTEKMYEVADEKGLSLNKTLEQMKKEYHIHSEVGVDKILFTKVAVTKESFPNMNPEMLQKAQEMMSGMTPDELKNIQDQIENMSEEEKAQMMEKAKAMGLF